MFAIGSVDNKQMLCVVAQRRMNQMIQLQPDNEGRRKHHHGYHILQNDKDLAQHHLGAIAETALDDVDRLET